MVNVKDNRKGRDTARKIANSVLKNTDLAKNIKGMHQNGLVIKYKGSI